MTDYESEDNDSDGVECPTCGDTFVGQRGVRAHHAQIHGEKLRDTRPCSYCGEETEITPPKNSEKEFCDRNCYAKWQSENEVGENHPSWKGGLVPLICEQCGGEYKRKPSVVDDSRFCSKSCHNDWMAENHNGADHPVAKQSFITCEWCGEKQHRSPANVSEGDSFCSKECKGRYMSVNRVGENHPHWTGGRQTYGKGWNDKKKRKVRIRDQARCQECGRTEPEHLEKFGRKHTVHHIQKARDFDDPEERNAMGNLVTLCMGECHQKWEKMSPLRPIAD